MKILKPIILLALLAFTSSVQITVYDLNGDILFIDIICEDQKDYCTRKNSNWKHDPENSLPIEITLYKLSSPSHPIAASKGFKYQIFIKNKHFGDVDGKYYFITEEQANS